MKESYVDSDVNFYSVYLLLQGGSQKPIPASLKCMTSNDSLPVIPTPAECKYNKMMMLKEVQSATSMFPHSIIRSDSDIELSW